MKNEGPFLSKLMSMVYYIVIVNIIIDDIMVTYCGWQGFSTAKASYRGIFSLFPILRYGFPFLQKVCEIIKKNREKDSQPLTFKEIDINPFNVLKKTYNSYFVNKHRLF